MKMSEVYRRAAEVIEEGGMLYACDAIGVAVGWFSPDGCNKPHPYRNKDLRNQALMYFAELFRPERRSYYWFGPTTGENKKPRILALCFMAAIMESEGR